jgi:hypothetical protein
MLHYQHNMAHACRVLTASWTYNLLITSRCLSFGLGVSETTTREAWGYAKCISDFQSLVSWVLFFFQLWDARTSHWLLGTTFSLAHLCNSQGVSGSHCTMHASSAFKFTRRTTMNALLQCVYPRLVQFKVFSLNWILIFFFDKELNIDAQAHPALISSLIGAGLKEGITKRPKREGDT